MDQKNVTMELQFVNFNLQRPQLVCLYVKWTWHLNNVIIIIMIIIIAYVDT